MQSPPNPQRDDEETFAETLLNDKLAQRRIAEFLASGSPLLGNRVRSATLRKVVREAPGVADGVKEAVVRVLDEFLIKGQDTVEALALGMIMADISRFLPAPDMRAIHNQVRDLDKLPLVMVGGRPIS